jgi:2-polyprenyl-3-methyl-5-hydroxy-6-metoxy-1,4-benzoquinol methylase
MRTGRQDKPDRLDAVEFFDAQAKKYEHLSQSSPRFTERFAIWEELIEGYAATPSGSSCCIDLGCGVGTLSRYAASRGFPTIGIDGSPSMVQLSSSLSPEESERLEFRQAMLPLEESILSDLEGSADLVLASSVLEYMDDDVAFMSQCHQLLRPAGIAVISVPNATSLYRRIEPMLKFRGSNWLDMQPQQYTRSSATELAESVGFTVIATRYFAFPSLRMSRVIKRRSPLLATMFALVLRKS